MKHRLLLTLILFALATSASAASLLLTHATTIDGSGAPAQLDTTIVIEGARIQTVYQSSSQPAPNGAQVEDLRGRCVIPGLIDGAIVDRFDIVSTIGVAMSQV